MNSTRLLAASLKQLIRLQAVKTNTLGYNLVQGGRHFSLCQRCSAASKQEAEEVDDEPVKFTTSKAFKSAPSYINEKADENPTSRTVSIGLSMAAFMLWFFVLREESDWDEEITRNLYDRAPNLEKTNLVTAINYYQRNGMDPGPLLRRLKELEDAEERENAEGLDTATRLGVQNPQ